MSLKSIAKRFNFETNESYRFKLGKLSCVMDLSPEYTIQVRCWYGNKFLYLKTMEEHTNLMLEVVGKIFARARGKHPDDFTSMSQHAVWTEEAFLEHLNISPDMEEMNSVLDLGIAISETRLYYNSTGKQMPVSYSEE